MPSPTRLFTVFAALTAVAVAAPAHAGALNPWYGRLDDGAAAVTPYVYVGNDAEVTPSVYVQSSFAGHFDVLVGAGGAFSPDGESTFTTVDLMPRVFLTDNLGATVRTIIDPQSGDASVGPEVHAVFSRSALTFASNIGYADGTTYGLLAPELALGDRTSVFFEVNPAFGADSVDLTLVPGLGLTLDRAGNHTAALGVQVPALAAAAPSYGLWYSTGFGG